MGWTFIDSETSEFVLKSSKSNDNLMSGMRSIASTDNDPLSIMRDTCTLALELFDPLNVGITTWKHEGFIVPCYQNRSDADPIVLSRGSDIGTGLKLHDRSISQSVFRSEAVTLWTKGKSRSVFDAASPFGPREANSLVGVPWHQEDGSLGGTIVMWFAEQIDPNSEQASTLSHLGEAFSIVLASARVFARRRADQTEIELSPREKQVISLMCEGMGTKGVANVLGISTHTAKEYSSSAIRKLGAHTRSEATARAVRFGIVR